MSRSSNRTTIVIPAHNEAGTISDVVAFAHRAAGHSPVLVADVMVIDDRSTDGTAQLAESAGAKVVSSESECSLFGGSQGKGDAIWAGIRRCETELVTFLDADIRLLTPDFVGRLNMPLVDDPTLQLVKGRFTRVGADASGRVTMLTARPLLELLHPHLRSLSDPLSGMFATRIETIGRLSLDSDYGVDVGILIDVAEEWGVASIVEVDLGGMCHRNRDLAALSETAKQVARAVLARTSVTSALEYPCSERRVPTLSVPARGSGSLVRSECAEEGHPRVRIQADVVGNERLSAVGRVRRP